MYICLIKFFTTIKRWLVLNSLIEVHCGVMKFSADMPSCLEGGDHRTNVV